MTPVTFPLQKLPLLSMKNVFRSMNMEQLFDLSYCSKKTRRFLKACYGKNIRISAQFSDDFNLTLYLKGHWKDVFKLRMTNTMPGCNERSFFLISPNARTIQLNSSQALFEAAISMIDQLFNSFDLRGSEIFLDQDGVQQHFRSLVQSVVQRHRFEHVCIFGSVDREDLKYLIENCTPLEKFLADITIQSPYFLNLNSKAISFEKASWFTVSNLLTMSFVTGEFSGPQWVLDDWMTLLNAWIGGWNSKMTHLYITNEQFTFQALVDNLPFGRVRETTVVRTCEYQDFDEETNIREIKGGVDIRGNDGRLATIFGSHSEDFPEIIYVHVWN